MSVPRHEVMDQLWNRVIALLEGLGDQGWDRPVPWTPLWTVADLVAHMAGAQSTLNGAPELAPPDGWAPPENGDRFDVAMAPTVAARRHWTPDQRLDELRTAARTHVDQLSAVADWDAPADSPAGPTTREGLFRNRVFDTWVHLQDLHEALGEDVEVADASPAAGAAAQWVLRFVPWMFVKRAGAREGATLRLTLSEPVHFDDVLEVRQGRAGWNSTADPGDCYVRATPAALTLLTSGRPDAQRWRDAGALEWAGPRGDEFVELGRLF